MSATDPMEPSKLIIGIESCVKYEQRHDAVRETWLKDCTRLGVRAYFLVGRPGQRSEIQGDFLYLDCGDAYLDLPHKTIAFLRFVEEHLDYNYVYKCDDDTYVNLEVLLKLMIEPYDYCGHQYKIKSVNTEWHKKHVDPHSPNQPYPGTFLGPWMTGGSGYFLSKRALRCVINEYNKFIDKEFYEDKLIGDIMRTNNMPSLVIPLLKEVLVFDILFLRSILNRELPNYASFHPCSPRQIVLLHQRRYGLLLIIFFFKYILLKTKDLCQSLRKIGKNDR